MLKVPDEAEALGESNCTVVSKSTTEAGCAKTVFWNELLDKAKENRCFAHQNSAPIPKYIKQCCRTSCMFLSIASTFKRYQ